MPKRATKRGAERTPLSGARRPDLRCVVRRAGGRARVARAGARVLVLDRYEIGERQTSACGVPTELLSNMGLEGRSGRRFAELVVHTPTRSRRWKLPWTFSPSTTASCAGCCGSSAATPSSTPPRSTGTRRRRHGPHRPRRPARAADRRRARLAPRALHARRDPAARGAPVPRPRGPPARQPATTSSCGSTRPTSAPATRGRSRRTTRSASASARSTRASTSRTRRCGSPPTSACTPTATRATGSPTACAPATEDGVFFVGDSAGHCLPTTAEGIRTALYFGSPAAASCATSSPAARRRRRWPATAHFAADRRLVLPLDSAGPAPDRPRSIADAPAATRPAEVMNSPRVHRALGVHALPRHLPAAGGGPRGQRAASSCDWPRPRRSRDPPNRRRARGGALGRGRGIGRRRGRDDARRLPQPSGCRQAALRPPADRRLRGRERRRPPRHWSYLIFGRLDRTPALVGATGWRIGVDHAVHAQRKRQRQPDTRRLSAATASWTSPSDDPHLRAAGSPAVRRPGA